jgi:hypothetical protein
MRGANPTWAVTVGRGAEDEEVPLDIRRVGIVSQTSETTADELARVAAALNLQVIRDFAPIWDVAATVQVYTRIREAPYGTWLILLRDDIPGEGQAGFHRSRRGLPYAMVQYSHSWSLDASHELLEMLADPSGSELEPGLAPGDSFARVDYLREVCDPCQSESYSYTINTVMVSDFITRRFYDTVRSEGTRYSFKGHIRGPRELLPGGYLTFRREAERGGAQWFDWTEGQDPRPLDGEPPPGASLRSWVDRQTAHPDFCGVPDGSTALAEARREIAEEEAVRKAIAAALEEEIEEDLAG